MDADSACACGFVRLAYQRILFDQAVLLGQGAMLLACVGRGKAVDALDVTRFDAAGPVSLVRGTERDPHIGRTASSTFRMRGKYILWSCDESGSTSPDMR